MSLSSRGVRGGTSTTSVVLFHSHLFSVVPVALPKMATGNGSHHHLTPEKSDRITESQSTGSYLGG